MKTTIKLLILISLVSCTKDWACTIETTANGNTSYYEVDFRGTTQEKNDFEAQGTQTTNVVTEIVQVTTCVPD